MREKIKKLDEEFKELKEIIRLYNKNADLALIDRSWEFAKLAHHDQERASGDPYVEHCLRTAEKLAEWKLDTISIVVGLLHDTVERGSAKKEDVLNEFGKEVWSLVDGVSLVSKLGLKGNEEQIFVENLRKMFFAIARDIRVVLVKLAERYHNMQTISFLPEEKQRKIASETLEIYAPLAERLSMAQVKSELEDLSFPCVEPVEYRNLFIKSASLYKDADIVIEEVKKVILRKLYDHKIKSEIQSRKKTLYSLWKKLQRPDISGDIGKIYDIVALRILVNSVAECYTALGVVHESYKPVDFLSFSDFIAKPKPNGYRSIHTKIFGPRKKILEVQIRTFEMHEECEFGIAAHWHMSLLKSEGRLTSEQIEKGLHAVSDKLRWVKELVKWQNEIVDTKEFLRAVKFDALSERIFVFSPKGDVYDLPINATPVDFAYAIHTDLGNYILSVKVNGKIVPLDYRLDNGDVVEIQKTKKPRGPSRDWLEFVVSTLARREIRKFLEIDERKKT